MAAVGRWLKIRCFLEGVEVPVIAAQIQAAPDSPMVASIQIPPVSQGTKLLPRTLVHMFFHDIGLEGLKAKQAAIAANATSTHMENFELENYKLVFAGEMAGFGWTKTPMNRSLVLQCFDLSNYWDYAYQWNNTDLFGPGYKAMFSGGGTNLFTNFLYSPGEMLMGEIQQGIRSGSVQFPALKGLMGGIIRILEKISGCYFDPNDRKYRGANPFFALAELRLHITQMIAAYDKDPTARNLLGGSYDGMFGRALGNLGEQVSIRQAINALTPLIFHNTYPQPCPMYVPGSNESISGEKRSPINTDPKYHGLVVITQEALDAMASVQKTIADGGLGMVYTQNLYDTLVLAMQNSIRTLTVWSNRLRAPNESAIRSQIASSLTGLKSALGKIKAARKGLGMKQGAKAIQDASKQISTACDRLRTLLNMDIILSDRKSIKPARLIQQIFRPDVWFSAPPRCNVIFPDQYTQLNFSRSFMQEPTRFLLKTNNEFYGEDELTDKLYFAPVGQLTRQGEKYRGNMWAMFRNDLMEHELYTGVLPAFEKMGEFNIFAARAGLVNGKPSKIGLAQRSTNFLYFRKRYESRQMSIVSRFLPQIAVGFPGLVIDKYLDADAIFRQRQLVEQMGSVPVEMSKYFGTHFLGNVQQVSHQLDQNSGGMTNIQFTMARQPDESVEFMGIKETTVTVVDKSANTTKKSHMAAFTPPRVGDLGPYKGEIITVADITGEMFGKDLPLYSRRNAEGQKYIEVQVGVRKQVREYGNDVLDLFDAPGQIIEFRGYRIEEKVQGYRNIIQDLPLEEYMRPGWFGDCWHPGLIGKVYEDFFGTGAITDPTVITDYDKDANRDVASSSTLELPVKEMEVGDKMINYVSILDAVSFLLQTYSYIKQNHINADDFISAYTWRPIASMYDIFGSADLEYDHKSGEPTQGVEGFHSRAFGQFHDISTLLPPEIMEAMGINKYDSASSFMVKGDTRQTKQNAVLEMVSALMYSRAVLG